MELKCVVTTPVLRFLEQRLGRSRTRELISDTRMNPDYLEHTENWISYDYFCRLLRKVVEATGEPRAPLIAARDCSTMGTYGVVARFLKHLGSPGHSYQLIVRFHGLWTKVNTWRILESSAGRCTIEVQPARVTQDRNNCLAIQGSLAAVTRP